MRPPTRSRAPPLRFSSAVPPVRTLKPPYSTRKRKASVKAIQDAYNEHVDESYEQSEYETESDNTEGTNSKARIILPARKRTTQRHQSQPPSKLPVTSGDYHMTNDHDGEEPVQSEERVQDVFYRRNDPEKTWEEYQDDVAAEARELKRLAELPITRPSALPPRTRAREEHKRVMVKDEPMDDDEVEMITKTEYKNDDDNGLQVFIKRSIEEEDEEETKPTIEETEDFDAINGNDGPDVGFLEQISAAVFASSGLLRNGEIMLDDLIGMNIRRAPRSARSVAPRDFSSRRSASHAFTPRYKSGTVTRNQYKDHMAETYDSEVKAGEDKLREEVLLNRKQHRMSSGKATKVPCGQKSKFMLAVEAKMLVKERAEAERNEGESEAESEDEEMGSMEE